MAINEPRLYLICYDIADPHRLGRVYRYLCGQAVPVQYSVFLANISRCQLDEVIEGIEECIDNRKDDVRIYPLPRSPHIIALGQSLFPDGITLVSHDRNLIATDTEAA